MFWWKIIASPLTLSQVAASAYSIAGTLLGAAILTPREFTVFALLTLVHGASVGLLRSALLQPALICQRRDLDARTTGRLFLGFCLVMFPVTAMISYALSRQVSWLILAVAVSSCVSFAHDWLRHRCMAEGHLVPVLLSDLLRLSLVLLCVFAAAGELDGALALHSALLAVSGPALFVALIGFRPNVRTVPFETYRSSALWQTSDFALAQSITTLPMVVLGVLSVSDALGSFRFAQTLMGPVALLVAAISTNLLSFSASEAAELDDAQLITLGRRTAKLVLCASLGAVFVIGLVSIQLVPSLSGVDDESFQPAITSVGLATAASSHTAIHLMVLRLLGETRVVTVLRTKVLAAVWAGYAVGFMLLGISGSLVVGFLASAVAYPGTVLSKAANSYRKAAHEKQRSVDDSDGLKP